MQYYGSRGRGLGANVGGLKGVLVLPVVARCCPLLSVVVRCCPLLSVVGTHLGPHMSTQLYY